MCTILKISLLIILDEFFGIFLLIKTMQRSINFRAFITIQNLMSRKYVGNLYWKRQSIYRFVHDFDAH